jgi:flagellar biosynthesis GTPase FlhF
MSITSALIASTINKIKKDLYQLEDWLNSLHSTPSLPPSAHAYTQGTDVSSLLKRVEELTIEVSAQKHTIHHLVDRLDVMEETREIHIDGHLDDMDDPLDDQQDPWLSTIPLQNEIVDPVIVNIHREEPVLKEEIVKEQPVLNDVVKEEVVQEEKVEKQEEAEKEEQEAEQEEQEEAQEEEEADQEEEGVELEEITVKGVHYYKDPEEGFIYEIDSEGQPSENPVGVWKTKTQTISFYRST